MSLHRLLSRARQSRLGRARLLLAATAAMASTVAAAATAAPTYPVVSALAAAALDAELMGGEAGGGAFSLEQLMELAGLAVAQATHRALAGGAPLRVLVVAGPGNNGGDGLVAARHLAGFGHSISVWRNTPKARNVSGGGSGGGSGSGGGGGGSGGGSGSGGGGGGSGAAARHYEQLVRQLRFLGDAVELLEEGVWPPAGPALSARFDVAIDALFGFSFKGAARAPYDAVLADLAREAELVAAGGGEGEAGAEVEAAAVAPDGSNAAAAAGGSARRSVRRAGGGGLRVVSVDVPSGWPVDGGGAGALRPSVLVSLTAPKPCGALFDELAAAAGGQHWLGGRFVPREVMARFGLEPLLERYRGDEQVVRLR